MALLKKKLFNNYYLKNVSESDSDSYEILSEQILLGGAEKADFLIADQTVNHYHAVITFTGDALFITDLCTLNGTKVNGKKVRSQQLFPGDLIEIGNTQIEFGETVSEKKVTKTVEKVVKIQGQDENHAPKTPSKPNKGHETKNLFYVEGEYCNIKFDEKSFNSSESISLESDLFSNEQFIAEEERPNLSLLDDKDLFSEKSLDVIFVTRGNILSYDSIAQSDWEKCSKLISPELKGYLENSLGKKESLVRESAGNIICKVPEGFKARGSNEAGEITLSDDNPMILLEKGVHQIFIRFGQTLRESKKIPFLWRERDELREIGKKFFVFFLPFLLLTLVDISSKKEEKKFVVIYKKKKVERKKQSVASVDKKQDSPKKEQAKKVAENKSDNSKTKSKKSSKNLKKVANAKAKKSNSKKAAKKKKKKLALAANFSKMLGSSQVKSKSFKSDSSSSNNSSTAAMSLAKSSKLKTTGGGKVSNSLGSTSKYSNGKGYKSKGKGKIGFDSNFTATKTVVLGAIDPDILRRLLREHIPQFRYCYQEELGRNSKIKGILDLDFTINGKGKISKSKIIAKNGKFSKKGIGCITSVLRKIPFPKPKGGGIVEVRQPLNFSSEKTKV